MTFMDDVNKEWKRRTLSKDFGLAGADPDDFRIVLLECPNDPQHTISNDGDFCADCGAETIGEDL